MDKTFQKETTYFLDNRKRHHHDNVSYVAVQDLHLPLKKGKFHWEIDDDDEDDDIIITHVQADDTMPFKRVDPTWQLEKCQIFGLKVMVYHPPANNRPVSLNAQPVKMVPIIGDGNCLFRTMSFMVTGTQQYHVDMRTGAVHFMMSHRELFKSYMNEPVMEYLRRTGMWNCGRWGTDVEIRAFATMFNTNVFVHCDYGGKTCWTKFPPIGSSADDGIYIRLRNSHYEPVVEVEDASITEPSINYAMNKTSKPNPEGPKTHPPLRSSAVIARNKLHRTWRSGKLRFSYRSSGVSVRRHSSRPRHKSSGS